MTQTQLYLGVDLHKRTSTWVGIDPERNEVFRMKCPVNYEAVEQLLARLPAPPEQTALALEPVCGWRWVAACCEARGIRVYPANPKKLREIAASEKKTDLNDARSLANLLRADYLPGAYRAPAHVHDLRVAVRHRQMLVARVSGYKCRIHALCTAEGAHATSERPLAASERERLHREGCRREILDCYALIEELRPYLKAAEQRITALVDASPELRRTVALLETVPGIGRITAAVIAAETGTFERFASPKHLASHAGLNPVVRASGEKHRSFRMSKEGSGTLRAALLQAAVRVRNTDGARNLFAYYERLRTMHRKSPLEARVALAHKMLTCAWYLVRRNVAYDDRALRPAQSGASPEYLPGA